MSEEPDIDDDSLAEIEAEVDRELASSVPEVSVVDDLEENSDGLSVPVSAASHTSAISKKAFLEAKDLWESGKHTLNDIAAKIGVPAPTLQRALRAAGSRKGSRAVVIAGEEKSVEARIDELQVRRIGETKEQHYSYAEALAKLTIDVVVTAKRNGLRFSTIDRDIAALGKAAKTMEVLRKERYAILGLDRDDMADPEDTPELMVSELTAEQIQEIRAQIEQGLVDEDDLPDVGDIVDTSDE